MTWDMTFALAQQSLPASTFLWVGLGSILVGLGLYAFGFRGLQLPAPLPDGEKRAKLQFYKTEPLSAKGLGGWSLWMMCVCVLATALLGASILYIVESPRTGQSTGLLSFRLILGLASLLLVCLLFSYWGTWRAWRDKRLSPEVARLVEGSFNKTIGLLGMVIFGIASWQSWSQGRLSWIGLVVGLLLFPVAMIVSRVEGRFFFLFLLQEFSRLRDWDLLAGKPTSKGRSAITGGGWLQRGQAGLAIFSATAGVVAIPMVVWEFFQGAGSNVASPSTLQTWAQQIGLTGLIAFISLGPLAALATRPFGFLNVWLHQRLYEQIASPWDIKTMNHNIVKWDEVVRLPQPKAEEGFGAAIALAGGGLLAMLALTLSSRLLLEQKVVSAGSGLGEVAAAIEILQLVSFAVLLISLLESLTKHVELRTTWVFAREGAKSRTDLINHSLYGLHWCRMRWQDKAWLAATPKDWGLPGILYSINDHPHLPKQEQLHTLQAAQEKVLPPLMKPVAWQQLGAFLIRINRAEEAKVAFESGVEAYPNYAELWANLIQCYTWEADEVQAKKAYRMALKADKKTPGAYANWGTYLAQQERFDEAAVVFQRGITYNPNEGLLWFNYALTLERQGRTEEAIDAFKTTIKRDPFQARAWLIVGDALRDAGDMDGAEQHYRKGIKASPYDADAWQGLGEILLRTDRLEEAEKAFRKALDYDQSHAIAWNNLAITLREQDDPEGAVEALRTAISKDPKILITWESLAELFATYGMWAEAEGALRGALSHFPEEGMLHRNLAFMLRQQGRTEEAFATLQQGLEQVPEHPGILEYQAELEAGGGVVDEEAQSELEAPEDPSDPDAWIALAEAKFGEGLWGEAEYGFRQAIALQPDNPQLSAMLGDVLCQLSRFTEAEEAYAAALALDPEHYGAQINLAVALMQQGKAMEAEQAYRDAVNIDPTILSAWTYLFHIAAQEEAWDRAVEYHEMALQHLPESAEVWFSYGYLLARLHQMEEAEQALRQGLTHHPDHTQMRITLGDVLFHLDKREESAATFRKATEQEPENVGAWLKLATVLMKSGEFEGAEHAYRQSVELHPDWIEALFNLICLNAILGRHDDAFTFMQRTLETNPEMLEKIQEQPDLDVLHQDPRWYAMLLQFDQKKETMLHMEGLQNQELP